MKAVLTPALLTLALAGCAQQNLVLPALNTTDVGQRLEQSDYVAIDQTTFRSLEYDHSGRVSTWSNGATRNSGSVVPVNLSYLDDGTPCREVEQTATVQRRTATAAGRACRSAQGVWSIVHSWLVGEWRDSPPDRRPITPPPPPYYTGPEPTPPPRGGRPPLPGGSGQGNWQPLGDSLAPGGRR